MDPLGARLHGHRALRVRPRLRGVFADDQDARVGLNVLAGITGVFAVAAFRALHGKPILSAWLLLGPLPGVIGAWLTFR